MFKLIFAIWVGKLISFLTRKLNLGGGSAAPGLYALSFDPNLVKKLAKQIPQNIVITGTNGKTTTAKILDHLVKNENLKTLRNASGSNLERGIASALLSRTNIWGKIKGVDLGIWELDEAAFNKEVIKLNPKIIIFLNVFRDQLDRYGEVDSVLKKWHQTLTKVNWNPIVILNSGDSNLIDLKKSDNCKFSSYKIKNHKLFTESLNKKQIKTNDFEAEIIKNNGLKGTEFRLSSPKTCISINFPVAGVYQVYNFLAAVSAYYHLNLPLEKVPDSIKSFSPAFGRVEEFNLQPGTLEAKNKGYILLIKNPVGATFVLDTIIPELEKEDRLLLALNDNFADGTDVSWIWDAAFERLSKIKDQRSKILVSGTRAYDLALRLKYAGISEDKLTIEPNLTKAFSQAKSNLKGSLFVLPTYTALLELQKILVSSGVKRHYWKGE